MAWLVSQVPPAWTMRYLALLLGPMLLVAALGLARRAGSAWPCSVIILAIWAVPRTLAWRTRERADLRRAAVPELRQGDLVL